jgi:hypothetical protein
VKLSKNNADRAAATTPAVRKVLLRHSTSVVVVILTVFAAVSVGQGFLNAVRNSQDLQWSPVSLLAGGTNPYTVALQANHSTALLLYQVPPYLHILYTVILPLAFLKFRTAATCWAVLGIGLAVLVVLLIAKRCRLDRLQTAILLLLFLCGTPFRNTIGNGQTSLVLLFFLAVSWYQRDRARSGVALAIASAKYSFVPAVWLWLALERRYNSLLVSIATLVFGWLAFSALAHSSPAETLLQPFEVASKYSLDGGVGDIMTAIRQAGLDLPVTDGVHTSYLGALLVNFTAFLVIWRRASVLDEACIFAALCIASLLSFRHLAYDYVLLTPALALSFSVEGTVKWVLSGCVVYFWFWLKVLDTLGVNTSAQGVVLFSLVVNCVLFYSVVWQAKAVHGRPFPENKAAPDRCRREAPSNGSV